MSDISVVERRLLAELIGTTWVVNGPTAPYVWLLDQVSIRATGLAAVDISVGVSVFNDSESPITGKPIAGETVQFAVAIATWNSALKFPAPLLINSGENIAIRGVPGLDPVVAVHYREYRLSPEEGEAFI